MLFDDLWSADLRIRLKELEAGLPISERMIMYYMLLPPNNYVALE
jgi:hypothetical protein